VPVVRIFSLILSASLTRVGVGGERSRAISFEWSWCFRVWSYGD
jgi:hypothetical protein